MAARRWSVVTACAVASACAAGPERPSAAPAASATAPSTAPSGEPCPVPPEPDVAPAPVASSTPPASSACPEGMIHITQMHCGHLERRCLRALETADHRHICTEYAKAKRCDDRTRERLDFCVDRYEYPNVKGAHPVGVSNWYDAASTCASVGKRLCWESEWTAACEGPDELPFPNGLSRDTAACNIDLPAQMVLLDRMLAKDPEVQRAELARVDRSHASGAKPACDSGYGVADMTGNFDEWVNGESMSRVSKWSALKGGSWIRSRNSCRGVMTGHGPSFRFHTLGFRCCQDVVGGTPRAPSGGAKPPAVPKGIPDRHVWPGGVRAQ